MHFVNQINFKAAAGRCVLHIIEKFTSIFDPCAGCSIHLNQIDKTSLRNLSAGGAFTTRPGADALLTVKAFSQNPGNCRFAHAARASEQIRMMETPFIERIDKRAQDVLLSDHFIKETWTPFSRKYLITHENLFGLNTCIQVA